MMTYLNDLIDLKKQKQMSHQYLSNGMKHHSKQTRGQIAVDRRQTKRDRFIQKKKKREAPSQWICCEFTILSPADLMTKKKLHDSQMDCCD